MTSPKATSPQQHQVAHPKNLLPNHHDNFPSLDSFIETVLETERKNANLLQGKHVDELKALVARVSSSEEEEDSTQGNQSDDSTSNTAPVYSQHPIYHTSRLHHFVHALKLSRHAFNDIHKYNMNPQVPSNAKFLGYIRKIDEPIPIFMHFVMFVPALEAQCDEEQRRWWLEDAKQVRMLGCYAQTEIAHGSNVRGLLTTARFDHENDQFVLHTPCVEACKFWVGALGKTATHAVLMANLIIPDKKDPTQEKNYGVHPFLVPLRDPDNFNPFPGVEVWDIGDKLGFKAMDNGMLKLTHYRIPRRNMLMRFAKVTRQGEYIRPKVDKLHYGTMVSTRAYLVSDAQRYLAKSLTISIRYSAQRKQFWSKGDDGRDGISGIPASSGQNAQPSPSAESPVLNYLTQQHRLFSVLAESYAFAFTSQHMREMYVKLMERMKRGDFSTLAELHATTAGLKSHVTARVLSGIDECRKACGGHGFSFLSGLPQIFGDYAGNAIAEGEEYILSFQTGRFCLKTFSKVLRSETKTADSSSKSSGVKLGETVEYMKNIKEVLNSTLTAQTSEELLEDPFQDGAEDDDVLISILRYKCLQLISVAATKYQQLQRMETELNGSVDNEMGLDLYNIMKAHCECTVALCFKRAIKRIQKLTPESRRAITALYQLYCLNRIEDDFTSFLMEGYMNKQQVLLIRETIRKLLHQIRPDAVPLVDAFDIPDATLRSVLGQFNGNYARLLFEGAKNSEFNNGKSERILKAHLMREIQPILRSKY